MAPFKVKPCEGIQMNNGTFALSKVRKRRIFLANNTANDLAPWVIVRIRCSGKLHEVAWHERGRVQLLDHPKSDILALRTLQKLGDTTCGCLSLVDKIRDVVKGVESASALPAPLRVLARAAHECVRERRYHKGVPVHPAKLPAGLRWNSDPTARGHETNYKEYWKFLKDKWRFRFEEASGDYLHAHSYVGYRPDTYSVRQVRDGGCAEAYAVWMPGWNGDRGRTEGVSLQLWTAMPLTSMRVFKVEHVEDRDGHSLLALEAIGGIDNTGPAPRVRMRVAEASSLKRPASPAETVDCKYVVREAMFELAYAGDSDAMLAPNTRWKECA
jgi:hypothetical protein